MSLMDLFRSKGSARPSAGSQRGDWKDWFLNREGMAGKFNRRKDEDDWIDYNPYMLFNGGGSVRRDRPPNTPPPGTGRVGPPSNIGRDRMGGSYNPRRDPTPNTMGLMQGDLRDTHHYPEGPLGVDLNSKYNDIFNKPGTGQIFNRGNTGEIGGESYWNAALQGGMNRDSNEGIMSQMAYRPGSYGSDYDYDDYGPFISPSVLEMDESGGEYDPVDDEYNFDLLRGNLTSMGQSVAELTEDQMNLMRPGLNQPNLPGGLTKEQLWNKVKENEYEGWGGILGFGSKPPQEDTTREEYDDYYKKLLEGEINPDTGRSYWVT